MPKIGIIGGSGLDDPRLLEQPEELEAETAFGSPSSPLTLGRIAGVDVAERRSLNPARLRHQCLRQPADQNQTG